ncbi:aldo/keto reductase [Chloroflexota bacterium]
MIMEKRRLGQTEIMVTPIGLGGNKFSGNKGIYRMIMPDLKQEEIDAIIATALDGGINWFDTAEMYGFGRSEQAIASALRAAKKGDDEIVIADKWSPFLRTARNLHRTIDKRLSLLDGYTIDLYMVHYPFGFSSPEAEMGAMAGLVQEGKISSVGVSNFSATQMRRAHAALAKRGLPLAANQVEYSLIQRRIETNGVLDAARELGVTIIAWAPLGSGILTGKFHDPERFKPLPIGRKMMVRGNLEPSAPVIRVLEEIAVRYHATPAQIAVNWLVNVHGETVVAIPGASNTHHAQQSASSMALELTEEEMALLDEVTRDFQS